MSSSSTRAHRLVLTWSSTSRSSRRLGGGSSIVTAVSRKPSGTPAPAPSTITEGPAAPPRWA